MTDVNFDQLSNKEITELWKQSREEAIKQRNKNDRMAVAQIESDHEAMAALGVGEGGYWKDSLGYIHEGVRPKPKLDRYYTNAEGYIVDLAPGEKPPISQGATLLDKVTNFVNQNLTDPQIADLLSEEDHVLTANYNDYLIVGSFDEGQWKIRAQDEVGDNPDIKFRMPGSLDQDEAASHARNYVKNAIALRFRDLSETEINKIQRLAASNRDAALSLYICGRLPKKLEQEFVGLGAEAEITGSTMELLEFTANPEINPIVEEAVYAVWYWSKPGVELTPELDAFIQEKTADRALTFALLDSLFQKFQASRAIKHFVADAGPSLEDLEILTDAEVEDLHRRTRLALARANR